MTFKFVTYRGFLVLRARLDPREERDLLEIQQVELPSLINSVVLYYF